MALPRLKAGVLDYYPSDGGFAITPDDNNDLAEGARRIYAGGAGNISMIMLDGSGPFTFAFAAGEIKELAASRIRSTSTTATGIIGLR